MTRLCLAAACLAFLTFPGAVQAQQAGQPGTQPESGPKPASNTGMEQEAVPEGWVRIATDTNGDGRYDRVEMIYVQDLEAARRNSARRARGGNPARNQGAIREGTVQAEGEIESLYNIELVGMEGEQKDHQLVRIKTDQGHNIRVDLGPRSGLSGLDLAKGQTISVRGTVGTINDRPVLMAEQVSSGGKSVTVLLPDGLSHQRFQVQVLETRAVRLQEVDGEQVIARLHLLNGGTIEALLGPKDKLAPLDIQVGDTVELLAHLGRVNFTPVLIAEQLHHGDKLVSIDRPRRGQGQTGEQYKILYDAGDDKPSSESKPGGDGNPK